MPEPSTSADVGKDGQPVKKKLTKKEKEKAEKELRKSLPPLSQVGRNGVFEMVGRKEVNLVLQALQVDLA